MQNKNLLRMLVVSLLLSTTVVASQSLELELKKFEDDLSAFACFTGLACAYSTYSLLDQKDLFTSQIVKNDDSRFKKVLKYGFKSIVVAAAFFAPRLAVRKLTDRAFDMGCSNKKNLFY